MNLGGGGSELLAYGDQAKKGGVTKRLGFPSIKSPFLFTAVKKLRQNQSDERT